SSISKPINTTTPPTSTRRWYQSCLESSDFSFALLIGPFIARKYHGKVAHYLNLASSVLLWYGRGVKEWMSMQSVRSAAPLCFWASAQSAQDRQIGRASCRERV